MKKNITYLILFALVFTACKDQPKNHTSNAEKEAQKAKLAEEKRKEIETKCYTIVHEYLLENNYKDSSNTLDTLVVTSIDSASEKIARAYHCDNLLRVIEKTENLIKLQKNLVEASEKVSPILAKPEKIRLKNLELRLKIDRDNYNECLKANKTTDSTNYSYYQVSVEEFKTFKRGEIVRKDTLQNKYYINKNSFELKKF